jgi:hypothetical protein
VLVQRSGEGFPPRSVSGIGVPVFGFGLAVRTDRLLADSPAQTVVLLAAARLWTSGAVVPAHYIDGLELR